MRIYRAGFLPFTLEKDLDMVSRLLSIHFIGKLDGSTLPQTKEFLELVGESDSEEEEEKVSKEEENPPKAVQ